MICVFLVAMAKPQNTKNESVNVCPLNNNNNSSSFNPVIQVK